MKLIALSQGKFTKVDDEDYEKINQYKWRFSNKQGVATQVQISGSGKLGTQKRKTLLLHRFILNAPRGLEVDHKNGDKLDNRRSNLRVCSHAENMRNRKVSKATLSGFKGVRSNGSRWQAYIMFNEKFINLGQHDTRKDAARAYNKAALVYFGEFARLNEL